MICKYTDMQENNFLAILKCTVLKNDSFITFLNEESFPQCFWKVVCQNVLLSWDAP